MGNTIHVAILSQSRLLRETIASRLRAEPDIELAGSAETVEDLVAVSVSRTIDVLVLDLSLERCSPEEIVWDITSLLPQTRVVSLLERQSESEIVRCVEAGASACLECDVSYSVLLETLRAVVDGHPPCSLAVLSRMIERIHELQASEDRARCDAKPLTFREIEVARLTAAGMANKEIARRLGIKASTVKSHVHSILQKLDTRNRRDLIHQADQYGLLKEATNTTTDSVWNRST